MNQQQPTRLQQPRSSSAMMNQQTTPLPQQPRASLSQSIAFLTVYRRAAKAILLGPTIVLLIPLSITATNFLTRGHGWLAILISQCIRFFLLKLAFHLSPTPRAYQRSINTPRLHFLSIGLTFLVVWFAVIPLSDATNVSLEWYPPLWPFCRFALALMAVQFMVLARYFGPQSIMRVSSFPLLSNPVEAMMLHILRNPKLFLMIPGDTPGEYHYGSPQISSRRGRRFRHPSVVSMTAQLLSAILAGFAVAYIFGFDFVDAQFQFERMALLTGCVVTTPMPLLFLARGDNHEMDPSRYARGFLDILFPRLMAYQIAKAILVLPVAFGASYLSTQTIPSVDWAPQVIKLFLCLVILNSSITLFDELVKLMFFFDSDFEENVDITLRCILPSTSIADRALSKDFVDHQNDNPPSMELKRVESLITETSHCFMSKVEEYIEAPLEEDVMRFNVLQALGGGTFPTKRQLYLIQKYVDMDLQLRLGRTNTQGQPDSLLLLRGLCIFAGGVSHAIRQTTEKRKFQKVAEHWVIPPGAVIELIYTIKAIERTLQLVVEHSSKSIKTQVSVVLPAVVTTLYHLRTTASAQVLVTGSRSNLSDVVAECDRAAVQIMSSKSSTPEAIYQMHLDRLVSEWLQRSSTDGRQ